MRYPHHLMEVGGTRRNPSWCYTIGFPDHYGHPEVVASSVDPRFLNALADIIRGGASFREGSRLEGLLRVPVVFKHVPEALHGPEVTVATQHHGARPFELLQMVWPDEEGRYPWDPGYVNDPRQHQLWRPGGPRGHGRLRKSPAPSVTPVVQGRPRLELVWDRSRSAEGRG
jgi:hypothetical protein